MRRYLAKRWRRRAFLVSILALTAMVLAIFTPFPIATGARYPLRVELAPQRSAHSADALADTPFPVSTSPTDELAAEDLLEENPTHPSSPDRTPPATAASDPVGLLAFDFDLSPDAGVALATGDQRIEIAKPLTVNGREAGKVALRVEQHSRLYLDRSGLARALSQIDGALADRISDGTQQFISFDELRASGIAVRYDPVADGIRLET